MPDAYRVVDRIQDQSDFDSSWTAASSTGYPLVWDDGTGLWTPTTIVISTNSISASTPSSGAGNSLTLSGSAAVSGNTNGGDLNLQMGALSGSGVNGYVNFKNPAGTTVAYMNSTGEITTSAGSVSSPGLRLDGGNKPGFYRSAQYDIMVTNGSANIARFVGTNGGICLGGYALAFHPVNSNMVTTAGDTSLYRYALGVLSVGTGSYSGGGCLRLNSPSTTANPLVIQLASGTPTADALQVTLSDGTTELLDIGASGILGAYNGLKLYSNANAGAILQDGTNFGLVFISTNTANPTMWLADNSLRLRSDIPIGWSSSSSTAVAGRDTGISRDSAGKIVLTDGSTGAGSLVLRDAGNIETGTTTGSKIGTATTQKIGFWNATPVVQQVLATGAGASVDDVITFLQTIGLCKQS